MQQLDRAVVSAGRCISGEFATLSSMSTKWTHKMSRKKIFLTQEKQPFLKQIFSLFTFLKPTSFKLEIN